MTRFLDCDDVLANFDSHAKKLLGLSPTTLFSEFLGDLSLVEKTSIKLALNYSDLVHTKAQMRPKECFLGASGFGIGRILSSERVDATG